MTDLKYYANAMALDEETGKPMPKVLASLTGSILQQVTENLAHAATKEIVVESSYSFRRIVFSCKADMRSLLKVQGFIDGKWVDLNAEDIFFYHYVTVDLDNTYGQYKFIVRNVGRVVMPYTYEVRGYGV